MNVKFYTRAGCHLCEDARRALDAAGVRYDQIDVDDDRDLQRRFGERVPVIEVDGAVVAEGDVSRTSLARSLRSVR